MMLRIIVILMCSSLLFEMPDNPAPDDQQIRFLSLTDFMDKCSHQDTLQVKITHVGPQDKPVPSVLFHSYRALPYTEVFDAIQFEGLGKENEAILGIYNFTTLPEQTYRAFIFMLSLHPNAELTNASYKMIQAVCKQDDSVFTTRLFLPLDAWVSFRDFLLPVFEGNEIGRLVLKAAR